MLSYVGGSKKRTALSHHGTGYNHWDFGAFSCKQGIHKTLWDMDGNKAKGRSREEWDINLALENIKARIIKFYHRISERETFVAAEMVRDTYRDTGTGYGILLKVFSRENDIFKKSVGKDRVVVTCRSRAGSRNSYSKITVPRSVPIHV